MAMEVLENGVSEPVEFTPCSICGRTFNPKVLVRHERVCSKNQKLVNKRPVFDISRKRKEGTDLQSFLASHPYLQDKKPSTAELRASEKKKNWRRKHEDFINSIHSARDYSKAELTGKSVPPPKPSQSNPDYVQCPYCDRRFEEYAAERHMPFCKEKNSRIERRPRGSKDTEKLNKRIMYKPPKLKRRSGDQETTPSNSTPSGYHLVAKKTNFSGTYTLEEEQSPNRQSSYQSPYRYGGGRNGARVSKSFSKRMSTSTHTSATQAGELPGSSSNLWTKGQEGGEMGGGPSFDDRPIPRQRSQLKTPQPVAGGNRHHLTRGLGGGGREEGGVGRVRQIRGASENDGGQDGSSFGGDGEGIRLGPVKPKGRSRALRAHADNSPPPHEEMRFDLPNGGSGSGGEGRAGSNSSFGSRKGVPLNQHGMTMGKFCYECGGRYPVPQAKYCCECGTKRI